MNQQWTATETQLWNAFANGYHVWKPKRKALKQMGGKQRRKALDKYDKECARKFAASWAAYDAWLRH